MNPQPVKIGIIGGAGPYASALAYRFLLDACYHDGAKKSPKIPELFLLNFPFTRGLSLEESSQNEDTIRKELQYCINALARAGVEAAGIACNTLHLFLDGLDFQGIRFISLPRCVLGTAARLGCKRLLFLGTPTAISRGLYNYPGIELVSPLTQEQKIVEAAIDRILRGKILPADSEALCGIIAAAHRRSPLDGAILGCTELPVLHNTHPLLCEGVAVFDSIQILAHQLFIQFKENR